MNGSMMNEQMMSGGMIRVMALVCLLVLVALVLAIVALGKYVFRQNRRKHEKSKFPVAL